MAPDAFVESYLSAWNRNDAEDVGAHLTDDGTYRDIPVELILDRAALIETLREFFADSAHRYERIGDILAANQTVAFQYRMVPLAEDAHARGLRTIRGAEFIQLQGKRAVSISDYYQLDEPAPVPSAASSRKYAKSGLSSDRIEHYKNRLTIIMAEESLYLSPNLTLPRLAGRLDCSVNHLSQVINAGFGISFIDWVSQFRIEHAKQLLQEESPEPVLSIAYAVGFNSNSAFYAAFKKWVGTTPTAYRDQNS